MKNLDDIRFDRIKNIQSVIKENDLISVPIMEKWGEKKRTVKVTRFLDENEFCVAHFFAKFNGKEIKIQICWHSEIVSRFPDKREYSLCAQTMRGVSFNNSMMRDIRGSLKES